MAESVAPVCVWLKRDLRVSDHPALAEAVARAGGRAVFAVFLYEPEVLAQPERDASHAAFERECLLELDAALGRLGIRLVTGRGEAVAMLEQLRRETGFSLLVAHEETGTGVTYARDRRVRRWAREVGVEFLELPQTGVVRRLVPPRASDVAAMKSPRVTRNRSASSRCASSSSVSCTSDSVMSRLMMPLKRPSMMIGATFSMMSVPRYEYGLVMTGSRAPERANRSLG